MIVQELSADWWATVQQIVESETGMELGGSRTTRLKDAVARVCQAELPTLTQLQTQREICTSFVERVASDLTIGESFFLRNENHMRVLQERILPTILEENRSQQSVRMWSAGCAGGEEPYSLAILLDGLISSSPDWHISILATDLNPKFLERGREARYRRWSFRQTNINCDPRYFHEADGVYQVQEHLRRYVRFSYLNLVKDAYPSSINGTVGLDLILFRNVAIYLKEEITTAILQRMYHALRPGGWLLLGETEVTLANTLDFEVHHLDRATIFRKPKSTGPALTFHAPVTSQMIPPPAAVMPSCAASFVLPEWVPLPSNPPTIPRILPVESAIEGLTLADVARLRSRILETGSPRARTEIRLSLVKLLLENAQWHAAQNELEICLREDPLSIECHLLQARLAEESGSLQLAEQSYRRALYIDRNCVIAHLHLGLVQRQLGDTTGEIRSLKTALKLALNRDVHDLVEFGDGICYGRLQEMTALMMEALHV